MDPTDPLDDSTRSAIAALLRPSSIAIAGASSDPTKLGSLPLTFLVRHGFGGRILPIHPKLDEIAGLRCYRSIDQIEGDIDLLVIAVAAARIDELLAACRPGQVKAAVILSSGFGEIGAEGARLQEGLQARAREKGVRFIGPNSVGIANLYDRVIPSISQVFDQADLTPGPIGFVSQSGAVGTAITALAHAEAIGIGYFLSTGNEGDLEFGDFCAHFAAEPAVRLIAGYVESIRDGSKFRAAALAAARAGKPVALIKVGASEAGGRAVQSHTGALAGHDAVYRAVFDQLGVVRAHSIEELIDLLKVFSTGPTARRRVNAVGRVAILSHSGGAGVLMADTCASEGLDVTPPSAALLAKLRTMLPAYASFGNPIDMTANVIFDPALMAATVREVAQCGEYDAVLLCVNLIWRQGPALAEQLALLADLPGLVGIAWIAGRPEPLAHLNRRGVAVFSDPVRCVKAIAARLRWEARQDEVVADGALQLAGPHDATSSSADLSRFAAQGDLLRAHGIEMAPCALVADSDEALAAAARLGYPVAAKLIATGLAHKSELGAVCLDLDSPESLRRAVDRLAAIAAGERQGFLVQKMIAGPLEVIVGMHRDAVFGPVIVVGLGGIFVEILRETVMRLAPFDAAQAERLIRGAKFFPLLDGARGRPKLAVARLAQLVSRLSVLACSDARLQSIDLNPVIVGESAVKVVDFKIECSL